MRRGHAQDLSGLLGQAGPTHNPLPELRYQPHRGQRQPGHRGPVRRTRRSVTPRWWPPTLFGIQARGGCSCAGPYGHRLLGDYRFDPASGR
jgi:hypothetical protein